MRVKVPRPGAVSLATLARRSVGLVCFFLIFLSAVTAAAHVLPQSNAASGLGAILLFGFLFICVLIHELGHAIAAAAIGWRVHLIVVFKVGYRPTAHRFQLVSRIGGADFAGFVLATPPVFGDWEKGRALYILGGPLANFVATIIMYSILGLVSLPDVWVGLLGGLALANLAMGFANLVPLWGPGVKRNDGATLLSIAMGTRVSPAMQIMGWLSGSSYDGIKARDWMPTLVEQLESAEVRPEERVSRVLILVSHYLGLGQLERAHAFLESFPETADAQHPAITIERAFLVAMVERDAARAAVLLEAIPSRLRQSYFNFWRAQMVVYALQGDAVQARSAARRARRLARMRGGVIDDDDIALFSSVESGAPPPVRFERTQPA